MSYSLTPSIQSHWSVTTSEELILQFPQTALFLKSLALWSSCRVLPAGSWWVSQGCLARLDSCWLWCQGEFFRTKQFLRQVCWGAPEVPATWRLRQEGRLSPGVWGPRGQHSETSEVGVGEERARARERDFYLFSFRVTFILLREKILNFLRCLWGPVEKILLNS